nr:hypothetical protein [uncultured Acetatifactor sp.]
MAEKDILEKSLLSYEDVFTDCINTLVYGGRRRLEEGRTQPAPTESFYQGAEGLRNQLCDTSRYLLEEGRIVAQYLIENETGLRRKQILRKASYQGGAYRQQLGNGRPAYAVIGIVMAWSGKGSRIPRSLHQLLEEDGVPADLLEQVDEARMEVIHMNSLPAETRRKFTGDMGFVADFLNEGSFQGRSGQRIRHPSALCRMMETLTGDSRFTGQIGELMEKESKGEDVMMCEYIDMLEARGEARGVAIGEARGVAIGEARGVTIGEARGETKLSSLLERLYEQGRDEEAKQAVLDTTARARLYQELHIPNFSTNP